MTDLALKKIDEEVRGFKGDKREQVMYKPVADALREFCRQQPEFAQAVYQSKKTLADCMKHVAKGVGNSISDIEAYRRAVEFYFPGARAGCGQAGFFHWCAAKWTYIRFIMGRD